MEYIGGVIAAGVWAVFDPVEVAVGAVMRPPIHIGLIRCARKNRIGAIAKAGRKALTRIF